jgi:peptidyl-tRNA hydrolase
LEDKVSYVTGRFKKADLETVVDMVDRAAEAVRVILKEGVQKAMNRFNRRNSPTQ